MYVTLIGRSNVGKSSLFNALVKHGRTIPNSLKSIVSDIAGTTKNAKYGHFYLKGNRITLVDTGGIEGILLNSINHNDHSLNNTIPPRILSDAFGAVSQSKVVFYVLDGQEGVTPLDLKIGSMIREWMNKSNSKPEMKLVVNKMGNKDTVDYVEHASNVLFDCYSLDFGDPLFVNALNHMGINEMKEFIGKHILDVKEDLQINLEDLALSSESFSNNKCLRVLVQEGADCVQNEGNLDDEIDRSIRTCASVKESFIPNNRWLRFLNNVCGSIPFTRNDGDYAIPCTLSPAQRLAKMYFPSEQQYEDDFKDDNLSQNTTSVDEMKDDKLMGIEPRKVLVLGSVGGCQSTLINVLSHENPSMNSINLNFMEETQSPNWHSVFAKWALPPKYGHDAKQPVELLSAAPLNLGGILGKSSSRQTVSLLRNCNAVILCADYYDSRKNFKVDVTKRELAWLSRAIRLHKPTVIVVPVGAHYKGGKLKLNIANASHEFTCIPIIPISLFKDPGNLQMQNAQMQLLACSRKIQKVLIEMFQTSAKTIETNNLNKWLRAYLAKWPPPWKDGSKVNVKFTSQVRSWPPTFVMWSNVYSMFPRHYLLQLQKALSAEFGFQGVPLKFIIRTTANPRQGGRPSRNIAWRRRLGD
ncbi:bifunctional P-loop containing nucleoside triphosphate hydrolase/GTPase Der [Babesia duncani]|uniref:Bifunctional P-loop containing nucleoside triphosphate hydrolase/GTPase Der n=1 Tax=Babesia duncani TaxID=323732 RepID=A0AAD9PIC3_9APIC|nr:bifunctional P-loop containing nucleoside triphosphate hydrolase/GTPase Der [Babesia duncani]